MTGWIGSVLAPLLKLWLSTQVERVTDLEVKIEGESRKIMQGMISGAVVSGKQVAYQGLQFGSIALQAETIALNIPQILQGKPLKLLVPLRVCLEAEASAAELQHCLQSDLVKQALGYELCFPLSDQDIRSVLDDLFHRLSDDLLLEHVEVKAGGLRCKGVFSVSASP